MATYQMRYKRWVSGLIDQGEKSFHFNVDADTDDEAAKLISAEWTRISSKSPIPPTFLGVWKLTDVTPLIVSVDA